MYLFNGPHQSIIADCVLRPFYIGFGQNTDLCPSPKPVFMFQHVSFLAFSWHLAFVMLRSWDSLIYLKGLAFKVIFEWPTEELQFWGVLFCLLFGWSPMLLFPLLLCWCHQCSGFTPFFPSLLIKVVAVSYLLTFRYFQGPETIWCVQKVWARSQVWQ